MNEKITINKASLKDDLFLKGDYDEQLKEASRNIKFDDSTPVHDDLKTCFSRLGPHLMRLCEQFDSDIDNMEECITCTGFSLSSGGVTLIGYRTLSNDRVLNLVSPFLKLEGDSFDYDHLDDLVEIIYTAKEEVSAYLFDGKHAPEKQLSLFSELAELAELADEATVTFIAGGGQEKTIGFDEFTEKVKKGRGRKKKEAAPADAEDVF